MKTLPAASALLLFCISCLPYDGVPPFNPHMRSVGEVPVPAGFQRVPLRDRSFAAYLRDLPLRKDKTVYLFNGSVKPNQLLHYAVIDVSTGTKNLQQCADAVMRLRAEYFFQEKMYDSIAFPKSDRGYYRFKPLQHVDASIQRNSFLKFMETVFIYCGTYTLEGSMKRVKDYASMQVGDVFVKGGAPGHAEIVVDMAIHPPTGKKIFLLAEGYMPAQDIHLVLNPARPALGPWFELNNEGNVQTASWDFERSQLKRW